MLIERINYTIPSFWIITLTSEILGNTLKMCRFKVKNKKGILRNKSKTSKILNTQPKTIQKQYLETSNNTEHKLKTARKHQLNSNVITSFFIELIKWFCRNVKK